MNTSERNIYVFLRNSFGTICQNMIPHLFKAVLVGVARKTTEERNAAMCLGDPNQRISITDTGLQANTDQKHTYICIGRI